MKLREFGVRVTQMRERVGLTITQLAGVLGVDYMQISRYEKGQGLPSFETAMRLAKTLNVSLDELAYGDEAAEPAPPPVFQNKRLLERMQQLEALPADRQDLALRVLDTVITGHALEDLGKRLAR